MKLIGLLFILLFSMGCWHVKIQMDDLVDLGENYYFINNGEESTIILNTAVKGRPIIGDEVIPCEVVQYSSNSQFIIALSIDRETSQKMYWVIDKRSQEKLPVSSDSLQFNKYLDLKDIKLKLKE